MTSWHPDVVASFTIEELLAENERLRAERDEARDALAAHIRQADTASGAPPKDVGRARSPGS